MMQYLFHILRRKEELPTPLYPDLSTGTKIFFTVTSASESTFISINDTQLFCCYVVIRVGTFPTTLSIVFLLPLNLSYISSIANVGTKPNAIHAID